MEEEWQEMVMTRKQFASFRWRYRDAVEANKETFSFKGKLFNTRYAGYLIEYLNTRFAELDE